MDTLHTFRNSGAQGMRRVFFGESFVVKLERKNLINKKLRRKTRIGFFFHSTK